MAGWKSRVLLLCAAAAALDGNLPAQCAPGWAQGFGLPGIGGTVYATAVFDDGNGPALYAGGVFTSAGGLTAYGLARWNGWSWAAVPGLSAGTFTYPQVTALGVFDDGSGPALYVAGVFTSAGGTPANSIAKWDGTTWSPLGLGVFGRIWTMAVYDGGTGPALHVGGELLGAGGLPANRIAKWDGAAWSPLGGGLTGPGQGQIVYALAVHDDGTGPALFAGGLFTTAGSIPANGIARWNGASWSGVGGGIPGVSQAALITALAAHDDGSGPGLFAGGSFSVIGGTPASCIARWSGTAWQPVGTGIGGQPGDRVLSLAVHNDGAGPALYAGGVFVSAGGTGASRIAKWDGAAWSPLGAGISGLGVDTLASHNDGGGPALFAAGVFDTAGGAAAGNVARWNASGWAGLGNGLVGPGSGIAYPYAVHALSVFDGGSGPTLHAGGAFTSAGSASTNRVARWDGSSWSPLGSGISATYSRIEAFERFDDGGGPALFAGGSFTSAGGIAIPNNLARWDGTAWSAVGGSTNSGVTALAGFDDGSGPALYAASGSFGLATGTTTGIARWDGTAWTAVGGGLSGTIYALAAFDDGTGPALYAGGQLNSAGGAPVAGIARWNGVAWTAVGGGLGPVGGYATVYALEVFDGGSGPALYAGGWQISPGGGPPVALARWNGAVWAPVGIDGVSGQVASLKATADAIGSALYAGGGFSAAGPVAAASIVRWDGSTWSALGAGINGFVEALDVYDDGTGLSLFAGGSFQGAGGFASSNIARWPLFPGPPSIVQAPAGLSVLIGRPAVFNVAAGGIGPMTFQWRRNGVPLPGAAGATLTLPAVSPADQGLYDVVVSNSCGPVASPPAALAVIAVRLDFHQPWGGGSLHISQAGGPPASFTFTALTFDPANGTSPGTGPWSGLHIPVADLLLQAWSLAPPFVVVLDAAGGSSFSLPAGFLGAPVLGNVLYGISHPFDPLTLTPTGVSNIASLLLL